MGNKFTKENLTQELKVLLQDAKNLSSQEVTILSQASQDLDRNTYINKVILYLKQELSILAMQNCLSPTVQALLVEISRQFPTTGPSSMWNFMIR